METPDSMRNLYPGASHGKAMTENHNRFFFKLVLVTSFFLKCYLKNKINFREGIVLLPLSNLIPESEMMNEPVVMKRVRILK